MARVYISSTYQDLLQERRAARRAIKRTEHDPAGMEKYGAKPIRVLTACEEDVKTCDLFVGIIGWRLGSRPDGKDGKPLPRTYTQHEFDWAIQYEIPRLLYLSPDKDAWIRKKRTVDADDTEIRKFRNEIEEMAHMFSSTADLEKQMGVDVAQYARLDKPKTWSWKFLPYFCDRTEQRDALVAALGEAAKKGWECPWLVVVEGDAAQLPRKFVECVRRRHLPEGLQIRPADAAVRKVPVAWPSATSAEGFEATIWSRLAQALALGFGATKEDTLKAMLAIQQPVVVHLSLPFSKWTEEDAAKLSHLREMILALQHESRAYPIVVMAIARLGPSAVGRAEAVREALRDFATLSKDDKNVLTLAALPNVDLDDVDQWTGSNEMSSLFENVDLMTSFDDLMEEGDLTMKDFVAAARPILEANLPKDKAQ